MKSPNNFKLIIIIILALLLGASAPFLYSQVKQTKESPKNEEIFINLDSDPEEEKITVTHNSPVRVKDQIVTSKKIEISDLQNNTWTKAYTTQEEIKKETGYNSSPISNQLPTNIEIIDINQDGISEILLDTSNTEYGNLNLIAYDGDKISKIILSDPFNLGDIDRDISQDKTAPAPDERKIEPNAIILTYKFHCEGGYSECNSMDAEITQDPTTYKWSIEYWKNPQKIEPYWTEYINEYNQGVDNWGENVYPPTKFLQYTSE